MSPATVVTRAEPAPEPWHLVTNAEGIRPVVELYRRRMWTEQSFRDARSGLALEKLWTARVDRIERMITLVAIVMLLSVLSGLAWRRRHGGRDPRLSTKRGGGALSIFRLGLLLLREHGIPPPPSRLALISGDLSRNRGRDRRHESCAGRRAALRWNAAS